MITIIIAVLAVIIGLAIGYFLRKSTAEKSIGSAELHAKNILIDAQRDSENIKKEALLEAKEEIHKMRTESEAENKKEREELSQYEKRLQNKEDHLDEKTETLNKKEQSLTDQQKNIDEKEVRIDELLAERLEELERVSGLTSQDAKQLLLEELKHEVAHDSASIIRESEEKTKQEANKIAREIIVYALEKVSADTVQEVTTSTVTLPNDDMKGRIIGREGRNIRTFESLTGVDLIIDDTPEAVTISCFDPVRREVARVALEKLILDGRIHPTRIEEIVNRSEEEINEKIEQAGKDALFDLGIHDMPTELKNILGRLKYRTSYGQNALDHSVEVAQLSSVIADELGANVRLAKRAGLLHDIGKAIDHNYEETHVALGIDLAKRYGEHEVVLDAIATHHDDQEPQYIESVIVKAADALSAARPGARQESLQNYIKRLEDLEEIANSFEGIEKAYAVQAGREIRVITQPDNISEDEMKVLSREIAKKIENEMDYPGQIKVNMIRETRAVEYAK